MGLSSIPGDYIMHMAIMRPSSNESKLFAKRKKVDIQICFLFCLFCFPSDILKYLEILLQNEYRIPIKNGRNRLKIN